MSKFRSHWTEVFSTILVAALLLVLIALHMAVVDRNIGGGIACQGCFNSSVVRADLVMVWLVGGALLAAGFIPSRLAGRCLHLLAGFLIVVFIADLLVFRLFNYRLFLTDAALFISERAVVWDQFSTGIGGAWVALLILLAVVGLLIFLFLMPPARGRSARVLLLAILIVSLIAEGVLESPPYVNDWATTNVFSANLSTTERVRYSPEFESKMTEMGAVSMLRHSSDSGPQSGRNVILVMVESWSCWHSSLFGGSLDWTPELDATALRGVRFTNFHSIGFSTTNGLVGVLGGQNIWSPFLHLFEASPFHSMWGLQKTLPAVFDGAGYETAFLTTGPISLYTKGEWMKNIGFKYVEGNDHPFYADEEHYSFNSPSDSALYRRGLQWIQTAPAPYLLVLETVSTHQPYIDPDSGEHSLEKTMRFADRAFGEFIRRLDDSGFFGTGLLIVVSDHRSMTPVSSEELERFGDNTFSRVPAFVVGAGVEHGSVDGRVLSQGDLVPTFEWWLTGETVLGRNDAVMLDGVDTGKCAFHARGDRRGLLEVICPEGHGEVRMEGDRTRFVGGASFGEERKKSILETVARERLAALSRHRQSAK